MFAERGDFERQYQETDFQLKRLQTLIRAQSAMTPEQTIVLSELAKALQSVREGAQALAASFLSPGSEPASAEVMASEAERGKRAEDELAALERQLGLGLRLPEVPPDDKKSGDDKAPWENKEPGDAEGGATVPAEPKPPVPPRAGGAERTIDEAQAPARNS